jgi:hypothetical protein
MEQNQAFWQLRGAQLASERPGDWILIAKGEVQGSWKNFEPAWKVANALAPAIQHAFLYRAGIDDVESIFELSPFLSNDPHWVQLGTRIRKPWGLSMAAVNNHWFRQRKGLDVAWGDDEARLRLSNGDRHHEVRAVASNLFDADLTLRATDAERLGLGRFTAPTVAYWHDRSNLCQKFVLRLRIPELDIEAPAMAYVLPAELTHEPDKLLLLQPLIDRLN